MPLARWPRCSTAEQNLRATNENEEIASILLVAYLHEFIVQDSPRGFAGCIQERFQAFFRPIIHAICAQDIELIQIQVLLYSSQCLDLQTWVFDQPRKLICTIMPSKGCPATASWNMSFDVGLLQIWFETDRSSICLARFATSENLSLQAVWVCTWHPTPMKRSFLTPTASIVASVSRLGDSVGLTPLDLSMSSLLLATICTVECTSIHKERLLLPISDQHLFALKSLLIMPLSYSLASPDVKRPRTLNPHDSLFSDGL